jgi:hypothetical protein
VEAVQAVCSIVVMREGRGVVVVRKAGIAVVARETGSTVVVLILGMSGWKIEAGRVVMAEVDKSNFEYVDCSVS